MTILTYTKGYKTCIYINWKRHGLASVILNTREILVLQVQIKVTIVA